MKHLSFKKYMILVIFCLFSSFTGFSQDGIIRVQQDPVILDLIALQNEMAQDNEFHERYKIQIFYGNNAEATRSLKEFHEKFPQWPTTIEYQTPNYKVWIGNFRTRLEADRAFLQLKKDYPSAFIFKPKGK